jgi:dethiobiotin synthetase
MNRGVFITGTDTGVGKTVVSAIIAACLRQSGLDVGVMKPFETGCLRTKKGLIPPDGTFLRRVTGVDDPIDDIVPCRFALPLAPMVAADLEQNPVRLSLVMSAFSRLLKRHEVLVVEGAGGLLVPITRNPSAARAGNLRRTGDDRHYFVCDLIREMELPVIVVTRATLGTINHTLLTARQARQEGLRVLGFIVNHPEPSGDSPAELTNSPVLEELSGCPLLAAIPFMQTITTEGIRDAAERTAPALASSLLEILREL